MKKKTPDSDAESTTRSLSNHSGTSVQRLDRDVPAPFSTLIDEQSSEKMRTNMVILLSLLQGLTENVMSGDLIALSCYRAADICADLGVSQADFDEAINKFLSAAESNRSRNPMHSMF